MKARTLLRIFALLTAALLALLIPPLLTASYPDASLPGVREASRQLMRIWVTGAPGGGMQWLRGQLAAYEKANPGVMTYVRQVTPASLHSDDSQPPDVVLFMPGDVTAPEELLIPLTGALRGEESLLRAGRWQGQQYAVPLCWSAWTLAIDSQFDNVPQSTPAPTTLLGRPAVTPGAQPSATAGYPAEKIAAAGTALLVPRSGGLFSLRALMGGAAVTAADDFASMSPQEVYDAFLSRKAASALLTTGQAAALVSLQSAGRGFPCRILTPEAIITDMVWMAGVTGENPAAAALIAHLTEEAAQRALTAQSLHGISLSLPLYGSGVPALVEAAARRSLTAVNAFIPAEDVFRAAWQSFHGDERAILPLL